MKKAELVFIPIPEIGHIVSTTEFAKSLLARDDRLSITILVITPPYAPVTRSPAAAFDARIRYIHIPHVRPSSSTNCPAKFISDYVECHKPNVEHAIMTEIISNESVQFAGLVVDLFCSSMIDIAHKLNVPSYLFFASGAAYLGFMLYLPIRHDQFAAEFDPSDPDLVVPTFANSIPTNVLSSVVFGEGYTSYVYHGIRFKETSGFIINTFAELEPYAINSLMMTSPPVYAVGPLLKVKGKTTGGSGSRWGEVMTWLDDQPPLSVVFLCFGSEGCFDPPQLDQIAMALEGCGRRFLWSIRQPPPKGSHEKSTDYQNIQEALPEGFLERIGKRGMVCGWAQQVEVLAHQAIGGFVSHCGWNSTLESLWYGVPVATWPMYAEQQTNAFQLVRELGLAVELTLDYRIESGEVVMADVIEKAINCLMDADNPVRKKVKEMSEKSRKAVVDGGSSYGGSSYKSLGRLIEDILGNMQEIKDA